MRRLYRITLTPAQAWIALGLAIACETFATLSTKASDGFTVPSASAGALVGFTLTTVLLAKVLEVVPTSIAYSIWTGLGSVVVTVLGVLIFGDHLTVRSTAGILLVIGGVIVLNRPVRSTEETADVPTRVQGPERTSLPHPLLEQPAIPCRAADSEAGR